jgi:predicted nucleic acid-binding protein
VREDTSRAVTRRYEADPDMLVWWSAETECASAISRLERVRLLTLDEADVCLRQLDRLQSGWTEVEPGATVRLHARRLLRVHDLRAADALHLAAAIVAAETQSGRLPFVTLDDRLSDAAQREGFPLVDLDS